MSESESRPLLEWLLRQHPDTPKTRAKQWIAAGRVSVNGTVHRKPHEMMADPGAGLALGNRHSTTMDCAAGWQIHPRVSVVHFDASLAIINKGAGIISVPGPGPEISALSVLTDFLSGRLPTPRTMAGKIIPQAYRKLRPLPVHRLDQYTSGLFCVAMNPAARESLIEQLRDGKITREYVAFAEGKASAKKGTWRNWLKLSADQKCQQIVKADQAGNEGEPAREAVTHFNVLEEFAIGAGNVATKLRLILETGLKHQIRLQAAASGLPLIGDRTYNLAHKIKFDRQALHAEKLALIHPATGKQTDFTGGLPSDLRQLEGALRTGKIASFRV